MSKIQNSNVQMNGNLRTSMAIVGAGMDKATEAKAKIQDKLAEKENPGILRKSAEYIPILGTAMKHKREKEVKALENAQDNVKMMMQMLMEFMNKYYS
ncbi:MAG: hypothetical protein ACM3YO_05125 [Bacteroidota bacterium]